MGRNVMGRKIGDEMNGHQEKYEDFSDPNSYRFLMENKQFLVPKYLLELCLEYLNNFERIQFFVLYSNLKESATDIPINGLIMSNFRSHSSNLYVSIKSSCVVVP